MNFTSKITLIFRVQELHQNKYVQQKLPKDGSDVFGREAKWEVPKCET